MLPEDEGESGEADADQGASSAGGARKTLGAMLDKMIVLPPKSEKKAEKEDEDESEEDEDEEKSGDDDGDEKPTKKGKRKPKKGKRPPKEVSPEVRSQ